MIGRAQMMREAVALTREKGHPEGGPLVGPILGKEYHPAVAFGMRSALEIISKPYVELDPRFFTDLETAQGQPTGDLPVALIIANAQGGHYIPLKWTGRALTFNRREFNLPSVVVPLAADDSWERMIDAIEKVVTNFYDRHQPATRQTPTAMKAAFETMRQEVGQ